MKFLQPLLVSIFVSLLTVSCAQNQSGEMSNTTTESATSINTEDVLSGKIDPVCGMEYDGTWTESVEHNGHTINFCSATCKDAFSANPDKYLAKNSN